MKAECKLDSADTPPHINTNMYAQELITKWMQYYIKYVKPFWLGFIMFLVLQNQMKYVEKHLR